MRRFPLAGVPAVTTSKAAISHLAAVIFLCSLAFSQITTPVPQIANPLVPEAVLPGSAGFSLTVNGTGFVSGSTVYWNGSSRSTTFVGSAQLIASILASDVAAATSGSVTVHNPGGTISNVALLLVTTPVAAPSFGASAIPQLTNQGTGYYGMLAGDYNGDGFTDVIVNQGLDLEVMQGLGNGSFQYPVDYAIPGSKEAYGEVLADFTNNGLLDVALSNGTTELMDVFLANPNGTLQTPLQNALGLFYSASAVGDFNGDGNLDLAVGAAGGVDIIPGKGNGTFATPTTLPLMNAGVSVAVGDFNRDGIPDIAAGNFEAGGGEYPYVSILLGNGDGTFAPHVDYTVGRAPEGMVVADFNGDGYPDIAVIDAGSYSTFYVLLNKGDGTFAPAVEYVGTVAPNYDTIAAGDFNGDGKVDLAIYNSDYCTNTCVLIFLGNGDGTFQPALPYGAQQNYSGLSNGPLTAGDFNRDGMLDIASPTGQGPMVFIQTPAPAPTIGLGSMSFAPQAVGTQSASQGLYMYQPGNTTITINSATVTGDFQVPSNVYCVLNPGNSGECGFGVTFTPTAAGTRTGSIAINSSGGTQYVSLVGTGYIPTAAITFSPSSLSFAAQALKMLSAYQSLEIANTGTAVLDLTGMTLTGPDPANFVLVNQNCGSTIQPGADCFVSVGLKPSQRGVRTASLSVADNAANSPQIVPLSGIGTTNSFSPTSLSFGSVTVGTSSMQTLTLTNVGTSATMMGRFSIVGADSAEYSQTNNCGSSLASNASCAFNVTFTPTAKGIQKAWLSFPSNGTGVMAPATVSLTGSGK